MMASVHASIEDVFEDVREMFERGMSVNQITNILRDKHGPGYGGFVVRAIQKIKAEYTETTQ